MIRNRIVLLVSLAVSAAHAEPAALWGPHVDIEAKPGSKRNLGEADLFLPLSQDARTLVFGNLRARFDNQNSYEGNLGAGIRRMLEGGWNLGAYGYWDHRRSGNGNFFDQATLGAEALGRDWDFRANVYVPVGTRAYALAPESTAAISGAAVQVTTAFREERALKGFDAEAGWRAPIFDSEASRQLRLYVGGYRFSDAGTTVEGPRLRAELALDELGWFGKGTRLFLSAEMQDDNARGGQSFLGVRLRIPLDKEAASARALTAQERRMTAPVMRDVDIVTRNRVSSTLVETASATAGGQAITVVSSAATAGNDLDAAVTAAANNSTIVLSGTFNVSGGNTVVVNNGKTLRAGATTVRTASGREAVLYTSATVSGTNVTGSTVQLADNTTLSGLTISNAYNDGSGGAAVLLAGSAGNISVLDNTLSATQSAANGALALSLGGTNANVVVRGNSLTVTGSGTATTMTAMSIQANTTITVAGNTLSASGGTTNRAANLGATTITFNSGSSGNVRNSGNCTNAGATTGSISFTDGSTCP